MQVLINHFEHFSKSKNQTNLPNFKLSKNRYFLVVYYSGWRGYGNDVGSCRQCTFVKGQSVFSNFGNVLVQLFYKMALEMFIL